MSDGWQPVMADLLFPIRTMVAEAAANNEPLDALQARSIVVNQEICSFTMRSRST